MIEYAQIGLALLVGTTAGVAIMAMLQVSRECDDEAGSGQVPPKAPPSPLTVRADTERLNWLQRTGSTLTSASRSPRLFAVVRDGEISGEVSSGVREAIDSAMLLEAELASETK